MNKKPLVMVRSGYQNYTHLQLVMLGYIQLVTL